MRRLPGKKEGNIMKKQGRESKWMKKLVLFLFFGASALIVRSRVDDGLNALQCELPED
jgi:hypothetical protein